MRGRRIPPIGTGGRRARRGGAAARRIAVATALAGSAVLAACGGGTGDAGPRRPTPADYRGVPVTAGPRVRVDAIDNRFVPERLKVRAGTRVRFVNVGRNDHNVLPLDGGGFRIDVEAFRPGAGRTFRFARAGVYRYYCSLHGTKTRGMIGVVVVVR